MDCILPAIDASSALSAALHPALVAAARNLGVEHDAVNLISGVRVDRAWYVQNVNAYHND